MAAQHIRMDQCHQTQGYGKGRLKEAGEANRERKERKGPGCLAAASPFSVPYSSSFALGALWWGSCDSGMNLRLIGAAEVAVCNIMKVHPIHCCQPRVVFYSDCSYGHALA